jgi:hypothetical protein
MNDARIPDCERPDGYEMAVTVRFASSSSAPLSGWHGAAAEPSEHLDSANEKRSMLGFGMP